MSSKEGFALTVHVSADEWAFAQRRLAYLEALVLRVVRERRNIQEWYSAAELAAMRLPGLPDTPAAVTRKAAFGRWPRKQATRDGRRQQTYHVASLPARSFDALLARVLDVPELAERPGRIVPDLPAVLPPSKLPANAAPSWVLPLMRLIKGEARGDLAAAWEALPKKVPFGVVLPTVEEAAVILIDLGLMERVLRG